METDKIEKQPHSSLQGHFIYDTIGNNAEKMNESMKKNTRTLNQTQMKSLVPLLDNYRFAIKFRLLDHEGLRSSPIIIELR